MVLFGLHLISTTMDREAVDEFAGRDHQGLCDRLEPNIAAGCPRSPDVACEL